MAVYFAHSSGILAQKFGRRNNTNLTESWVILRHNVRGSQGSRSVLLPLGPAIQFGKREFEFKDFGIIPKHPGSEYLKEHARRIQAHEQFDNLRMNCSL